MPRLSLKKWGVPLTLLALCIVSFGLLIPTLGFYWDDWPVIFLTHTQGTEGFAAFYQFDRPFSAWTYILTAPLFGTTPLVWHLFTLSLVWLTSLGLWWALRGLWPGRERQMAWIAILFTVYPAFFQHSIAVAYSQHFITYALFTFSLGAMIWAYRNPARYWILTISALFAAALHMLTVEYLVGLELVRPLVLWFLVSEETNTRKARWLKTLKHWSPYLTVFVVFTIWRLFFVNIPDDPNAPRLLSSLQADFVGGAIGFLQTLARDAVNTLLSAWSASIQPALVDLSDNFGLFAWFVALVTAGALSFAMLKWKPEDENEETANNWIQQALLLGAYAWLMGQLPVWFTGRATLGGLFHDRFALPAMFGASILWVAVIELFTPRRIQQTFLLGALVGLAVGSHLRVANNYRWDWELQRRFYWQLSWRAPGLIPGTPLVADGALSNYVDSYVASTAVNTLYPQSESQDGLSYWYFDVFGGFHRNIPNFLAGMPVRDSLRTLTFTGNSLDSLFLFYEPEGGRCLWVLSPADADNLELPEEMRQLVVASNWNRIIPSTETQPPLNIFGPEEDHSWCYYYQKADLARQLGNWQEVVALGQEAEGRGFEPNNGYERIPFIEAYVMLGEWGQAANLTIAAYQKSFTAQSMLCATWDRLIAGSPSEQAQQAAARVDGAIGCHGP